MARTRIVPVVDEGLGNSSYLADLGNGRALAVDVSQDLRAVRAAAGSLGLRLAFAAETHLHADFLSGARQLASDDGAEILGSAAGQRAFAHRGLAHGDEVDLGGLTLRAWETPGHTAEHIAYLLLDGLTGHVPQARSIELGALPAAAGIPAGQDLVVMCGHGERAATAASILERAGHQGVAVLAGGPPDWSQATGLPLHEEA